jgi:hypothetical protein
MERVVALKGPLFPEGWQDHVVLLDMTWTFRLPAVPE